MLYMPKKNVELKVFEKTKIFLKGMPYEYDTFIKTYPNNFEKYKESTEFKKQFFNFSRKIYDFNLLEELVEETTIEWQPPYGGNL